MKDIVFISIYFISLSIYLFLIVRERKRYGQLKIESQEIKDRNRHLERRMNEYNYRVAIFGMDDNKIKRLLCDIHDAYYNKGSDKVLKYLITSIGEIKNSSTKNTPKNL